MSTSLFRTTLVHTTLVRTTLVRAAFSFCSLLCLARRRFRTVFRERVMKGGEGGEAKVPEGEMPEPETQPSTPVKTSATSPTSQTRPIRIAIDTAALAVVNFMHEGVTPERDGDETTILTHARADYDTVIMTFNKNYRGARTGTIVRVTTVR